MKNLWFLFFGIILVSFGLGVTITQFIGERMSNGILYLGIGFIFLVLGILTERHNKGGLVK